MTRHWTRPIGAIISLGALLVCPIAATAQSPIYEAFPDTVYDFITPDDPSALLCVKEDGTQTLDVFDARVLKTRQTKVFKFHAYYGDGHRVNFHVNTEFQTLRTARELATEVAFPLGQIPASLRSGVLDVAIHKDREVAHAGKGWIVFHADGMRIRQAANHFEETVLHEAVHAAWDRSYAQSPEWTDAQAADRTFISQYARDNPETEDLAETVVFAYGVFRKPKSYGPRRAKFIEGRIPNRLAFLRPLLTENAAPAVLSSCP